MYLILQDCHASCQDTMGVGGDELYALSAGHVAHPALHRPARALAAEGGACELTKLLCCISLTSCFCCSRLWLQTG